MTFKVSDPCYSEMLASNAFTHFSRHFSSTSDVLELPAMAKRDGEISG